MVDCAAATYKGCSVLAKPWVGAVPLMMFVLPANVVLYRFDVRLADRKRAVAILPMKVAQLLLLLLQPEGRTFVQLANEVANFHGPRQQE